MNFYKHHIGDYATATSHLSFIEDGAYSRLIRRYYATEKPLPRDPLAVARLVGARSKPEIAAVKAMLEEFFELGAVGWHNARCDQEIAAFQESEPDRTAKQENARERQRRSRARRKELFDALRSHGIVPPFDASVTELETHLSRVTQTSPVTPVTRQDTGSQNPITINHYRDSDNPISNSPHTALVPSSVRADGGSVCGTFKKIGGESRTSNGARPPPSASTPRIDADPEEPLHARK